MVTDQGRSLSNCHLEAKLVQPNDVAKKHGDASCAPQVVEG